MSNPELLLPDWPVPARVMAASTTRIGGFSAGPYAGFNLGDHVGDDPAAVARNRALLKSELRLPREPAWLKQVHGTNVLEAPLAGVPDADASWTRAPGQACVVMAADCLPVLFCDDDATVVAAAHAGWRGLAAGVLEATVRALPVAPQKLLAWIGPCIGRTAFQVGAEVRETFVTPDAETASAFTPDVAGKFRADLPALARRRLAAAGVTRVHGGHFCTHTDAARFFSFRRDGATGRMAALVWLKD